MMEKGYQEFAHKARRESIPLYATFELTYRCNLRCVHCYLAEQNRHELSTGEICEIIDQLAAAGTLELCFTGGEALMRPDFYTIAAYARRRQMACSLLSNGTLINESAAEMIKSLHFKDVSISIYGIETHDLVTGVPGSFARSYRAVKLLKENSVAVKVKTPVMNINIHELEKLAALCADLAVDFLPNPSLTPKTGGSQEPLRYRLNDRELKHFIAWQELSGSGNHGFQKVCNAGRCMVSISPHGDVMPCVALRHVVGSLKKERFSQIWHNADYLKWLRSLTLADFKECFGCRWRETCSLCPAETLAEEEDYLAAHRDACRAAAVRAGYRSVNGSRGTGLTDGRKGMYGKQKFKPDRLCHRQG